MPSTILAAAQTCPAEPSAYGTVDTAISNRKNTAKRIRKPHAEVLSCVPASGTISGHSVQPSGFRAHVGALYPNDQPEIKPVPGRLTQQP
jgi:hypothetical protein